MPVDGIFDPAENGELMIASIPRNRLSGKQNFKKLIFKNIGLKSIDKYRGV